MHRLEDLNPRGGRPSGKPDPNLSLKPVVERLRQLLAKHQVRHCDEVVGPRAKEDGRGALAARVVFKPKLALLGLVRAAGVTQPTLGEEVI